MNYEAMNMRTPSIKYRLKYKPNLNNESHFTPLDETNDVLKGL